MGVMRRWNDAADYKVTNGKVVEWRRLLLIVLKGKENRLGHIIRGNVLLLTIVERTK